MLLSEFVTIILARSGQLYFLSTTDNPLGCFGLTLEQFWKAIVQHQLALYERYRPLTFEFNRFAQYAGQFGSSTVIFGDDSADQPGLGDSMDVHDPRVGVFNRDPGLVPEWISTVQPTEFLSTAGILWLMQHYKWHSLGEESILHEPRTYLWKYEKDDAHGILYLTENGQVTITAHYKFPRDEQRDSNGILTDVDIRYLDEGRDTILFDLVLGQFLQIIGRSRRAFQLEQNPVLFDASDLVLEGKELYDQAKQELYDQSKFYLAMGW